MLLSGHYETRLHQSIQILKIGIIILAFDYTFATTPSSFILQKTKHHLVRHAIPIRIVYGSLHDHTKWLLVYLKQQKEDLLLHRSNCST